MKVTGGFVAPQVESDDFVSWSLMSRSCEMKGNIPHLFMT